MLYDHQKNLAIQGAEILRQYGLVYYAFQMRVGKTLTALETANIVKATRVLFVTTKKARKSIVNDYERAGYSFVLDVTNYEALHKVAGEYDVIIADEAHSFGAYPKPAQRTKRMKEIVGSKYLILLSGTPSPESYSQMYHQLQLSNYSPWKQYRNFYKWAKDYVTVKQVRRQGVMINDYSNANKERILSELSNIMITYTQDQAGFEQKEIIEKIIDVPLNPNIKSLIQHIIKHKIYQFKSNEQMIVCDTAVSLMQKVHQLSSGTVITKDHEYIVLDTAKADYIKQHYTGYKIAIFYKFIAERTAIENVLGKQSITDSPEEFQLSKDNIFVSQIKSGALGIDLSKADILIFYNIDFSSQLYWQARERIQSLHRDRPAVVHWLFSQDSIENKIYDRVLKKKSYTTSYFRQDYR